MKINLDRSLSRLGVLVTAFVAALNTSSFGAATLVHAYELDGSYADTFAGPSLTPAGGTLSATGYSFTPNAGLSLINALTNTGDYSILIDFSFTDLSGYRRILDFKDSTEDSGFYNLDTSLNFYPVVTGAAGALSPDTLARVIITRDDATDTVSAYVNGSLQFSFVDSGDLGVFDETDGIMKFFIDDVVVPGEASDGFVDRIHIYDGALTTAEAGVLAGPDPSSVPDGGSTVVLLGGAMGSLGLVRRIMRRRQSANSL